MNKIAVVLTPQGIGSRVLINGVDISSTCRAIEITAGVGQQTEVVLTLVGQVELMADLARPIIVEHEGE